jgi:hypothetical protein
MFETPEFQFRFDSSPIISPLLSTALTSPDAIFPQMIEFPASSHMPASSLQLYQLTCAPVGINEGVV